MPILIIDDDMELGELLDEYLRPEGFLPETVNEPESGIKRALSGEHTLVVLDVMLPNISGFDVLRRIRAISGIPVLMLTARGDDIDRIIGLEMGADDYLPKPFNPRELVARLRAIHRRTGERNRQHRDGPGSEVLQIDNIVLDPAKRVVSQEGQPITMTAAEFSLLQELMQHAGKVISREQLSEAVLGRKLMMFDRSIDVHISNLRKKLSQESNSFEQIKTIRGVGYLFVGKS